jgi:hypothetical protein
VVVPRPPPLALPGWPGPEVVWLLAFVPAASWAGSESSFM